MKLINTEEDNVYEKVRQPVTKPCCGARRVETEVQPGACGCGSSSSPNRTTHNSGTNAQKGERRQSGNLTVCLPTLEYVLVRMSVGRNNLHRDLQNKIPLSFHTVFCFVFLH